MSISNIIRDQIRTILPTAFICWGAVQRVNITNGIRFKSSGMVRWKGYVEIVYNHGTDLYDLKFFKMRKGERKTNVNLEGVYVEDLVKVIDGVVG
ncbi:MAG: hypothetical protein COA84_13960 [Robiginitomaculum sp.]|nr:MAG: hypothetical protein COA84_13960 [Robiginitomaculum sp.]